MEIVGACTVFSYLYTYVRYIYCTYTLSKKSRAENYAAGVYAVQNVNMSIIGPKKSLLPVQENFVLHFNLNILHPTARKSMFYLNQDYTLYFTHPLNIMSPCVCNKIKL